MKTNHASLEKRLLSVTLIDTEIQHSGTPIAPLQLPSATDADMDHLSDVVNSQSKDLDVQFATDLPVLPHPDIVSKDNQMSLHPCPTSGLTDMSFSETYAFWH